MAKHFAFNSRHGRLPPYVYENPLEACVRTARDDVIAGMDSQVRLCVHHSAHGSEPFASSRKLNGVIRGWKEA